MAQTGELQIYFVATFSHDGTNEIPGLYRASQGMKIDFQTLSNLAQRPIRFVWRFPRVDAEYIKIRWLVLNSVSVVAWNYGPVMIAQEREPDSECTQIDFDIG